jgi:LacI family transcriptional regulator
MEQGHRRIAFINGPGTVPWCAERREGVLSGLREHGLAIRDALVEVEVPDLTVAEGFQAVETLLAMHGAQTAIMCANDMLALGALLALRQRHIDVPTGMALVGYDDVEFAAALAPPLTTGASTLVRDGRRGGAPAPRAGTAGLRPARPVRAGTGPSDVQCHRAHRARMMPA